MTDINKVIRALHDIANDPQGLSAASRSALDELKHTLPADLDGDTYALNLFDHLCNYLESKDS